MRAYRAALLSALLLAVVLRAAPPWRLSVAGAVSISRANFPSIRARRDQGLATVSDTESFSTRAEIEDALARLGIWRALLGVAKASGNRAPGLARVASSGPSIAGLRPFAQGEGQ